MDICAFWYVGLTQGREWSKRQARTRSYPALAAKKQTPTDWLTSKKPVAELRGGNKTPREDGFTEEFYENFFETFVT